MCPIEKVTLYGWSMVCPLGKATLSGWSMVWPIEKVTSSRVVSLYLTLSWVASYGVSSLVIQFYPMNQLPVTGCIWTFRSNKFVSGSRRRSADKDGTGSQAWRGRRTARVRGRRKGERVRVRERGGWGE